MQMLSGNYYKLKGSLFLNLDCRLKACADYVSGDGKAVDVGTDHAYLAAYLILNELCSFVIACDINDGPLKSALQTITKYDINEKVNIIKSDGLKYISPDGVSDVIIAGMGGELISKIIEESNWDFKNINLILQPMTKVHYLRKWLYKNGFEICDETITRDDEFMYTIMIIKYTAKCIDIDEYQSIVGAVRPENALNCEFLMREAKRLNVVAHGIMKSDSKSEKAKQLISISNRILEGLV